MMRPFAKFPLTSLRPQPLRQGLDEEGALLGRDAACGSSFGGGVEAFPKRSAWFVHVNVGVEDTGHEDDVAEVFERAGNIFRLAFLDGLDATVLEEKGGGLELAVKVGAAGVEGEF
ncbi:MAG: hypothetical protein AAB316_23590 [Bacteroidota bacterium]